LVFSLQPLKKIALKKKQTEEKSNITVNDVNCYFCYLKINEASVIKVSRPKRKLVPIRKPGFFPLKVLFEENDY